MGSRFFRSISGIIVILLGFILVLDNLGIVEWSMGDWWHFIYPIFFVLLGLKWFYRAIKGENGYGTPTFLIIFGSLLLLNEFDYVTFEFWDVYKLWPLILIFIGFYFLRGPRKKKFNVFQGSSGFKKMGSTSTGDTTFQDGDYNTTNWKVEPINIWNTVGDHTLDITKAYIPDVDTPIKIHGLAGDINIILPDHVDFSIRATVRVGEVVLLDQTSSGINRTLTYQTPGYKEATRKLTLNLKINAGSIRVDRI